MVRNNFAEPVEHILRDGGWFPGRKVSVGRQLQQMSMEGFQVFDSVFAFLEEFSGLRFVQPVPIEGVSDSYFHFDINEVCMNLDPGLVTQWEAWAGVRLCPIGESQHGYQTLSMSPDGSVFVGTEHSLAKVADSGADAVAKLASFGNVAHIH